MIAVMAGRYVVGLTAGVLAFGIIGALGWGFPLTILWWAFHIGLPFWIVATLPPFVLMAAWFAYTKPTLRGRRHAMLIALLAGCPWGTILYILVSLAEGWSPDHVAGVLPALYIGLGTGAASALVIGPALPLFRGGAAALSDAGST